MHPQADGMEVRDQKMNAEQINKMFLLFNAVREGTATDEQLSELDQMLAQDMKICKYYIEYIYMCTLLKSGKTFDQEHLAVPDICNMRFWKSLADYEKNAPMVELPKEKPQRELIQKVVYPLRERRKIGKFAIVVLLNAAAMLFFVLFLKFTPPRDGVEVATLIDSINAKWADTRLSLENGTRLRNDKTSLLLREGLVEIKFDNNAQVTIKGPAEFQIYDDDMIKLKYGQLYSQVPPEAYGFQVSTQHAKIIDLGTEFGVKEEIDGDTEVHVFKGKISIFSGLLTRRIDVDLLAGSALKLDTTTGELKEIPCEDELFVRQIDSKMNIVWRGQRIIDLADIVGGGNGFGNGQRDMGLDFVTGELTDINVAEVNRYTANTYRKIKTNPLIDGIFVPNGQTKQVISSLGHIFSECPTTGGNYYTEICSSPKIIDNAEAILDGYNYSQGEAASLLLHANAGITFNLQAIRSQLGGMKISRFRSIIGICDSIWRPCNADFWILVDGKLRYSQQKVQKKGILDTVDIDLSENDRFLTLITTDGGDVPNRPIVTIDSDWCLFAEPVLVLE